MFKTITNQREVVLEFGRGGVFEAAVEAALQSTKFHMEHARVFRAGFRDRWFRYQAKVPQDPRFVDAYLDGVRAAHEILLAAKPARSPHFASVRVSI